jgi:hypothetical protein
MSDALDTSALERWRADPASFIEAVLYDPETNQPFKLLDSERNFPKHQLTRLPPGQKNP